MTHRVHPYVFRIGQTTTWRSRWFNLKRFQAYLREDTLLREWLWLRLREAHVSAIEIERSPNSVNLIIRTSRPGILIGRGGEGIERLRKDIERKLRVLQRSRPRAGAPEKRELKLTIEEVRSPETDARIVAEQIRDDIEKRIRFRRILKQTVEKVMAHKEVKGVKVMLSGRLDGAEMSRVEWTKKGRIPLQTLRAAVDYAFTEAHTTYGTIGIKVWIYKGDVFEKEKIENRK
ncbi:MAG: 30S ribosomal protein S3 [Candidatus Sungbacteria bacterium]|uniref:Small ribosomal subunit protein uS3 n=1 Tax=Candidatus Sungiibacteriota bacterium TaxID=2750080 RepID=A0A933DR75_9BACT|nr:30S ribosomal protein S3 [Candidatus Sungbacteria bacterium]